MGVVPDAGEASTVGAVDGPASTTCAAERVIARWPAARPFVVVGSVATIAGGVIAAVTRPTGFELGSWMAAYLVLVGGVAQIALGMGQAWMADLPPRSWEVSGELVSWNLAMLATILGSVLAVPLLTTVGGAASVVALGMFLRGVRHAPSTVRWSVLAYRVVVAIVLISTPIGVALSWTRHG